MFFFIFYQRISTLRGTLGTGTRNCVDTQVGTITGHDGEGRGLGRGRAVVVAGSGARGGGSAGGSLGLFPGCFNLRTQPALGPTPLQRRHMIPSKASLQRGEFGLVVNLESLSQCKGSSEPLTTHWPCKGRWEYVEAHRNP